MKHWLPLAFIIGYHVSVCFSQEEGSTRPPFTIPPILLPPDAVVDAGPLGRIQGSITLSSPKGKPYYWFAGIPYADPNSYTGAQRFKPSSLQTGPLNGGNTFNALDPLIMCPQRDIFYAANASLENSSLGNILEIYRNSLRKKSRDSFRKNPKMIGNTEECLVINVNTPKIPKEDDDDKTLLPVLFFIHGGSFDSIWGGIFGGHRFINDRNVVVVSINYRLGLLGSLNLGIDEAPGNAMMYDVVTALRWVQEYIHYFGGDKNRVTVSGHSAGALMATHLLTSPMMLKPENANLFHKVIGYSGSSVSAWATCLDPVDKYKKAAAYAGCDQSDPKEIVDCMIGKSTQQLMDALNRWEDDEKKEGRFGFDAKIPSIQDPSLLQNTEVFMVDTPLNEYMRGNHKDVPLMMGGTRHDGTFVMEMTYDDFLKPEGWLEDIPKLRNEFFPILLEGLGMKDTTGGALIHAMAQAYLGSQAMNSDKFEDMIPGLIDVHSVVAFKAGAYNLLEMHAKRNPHSYYYSFDYYGFWTVDGGDVIPGVGHIDSMFYLFQAFPLVVWPKDLEVANRLVKYWLNFVEHGDPNGPPGSILKFPPFNPDTHAFLRIMGSDRIEFNCRESWINNSLEIKDHQRPGWPTFPLPTTQNPNPGSSPSTEISENTESTERTVPPAPSTTDNTKTTEGTVPPTPSTTDNTKEPPSTTDNSAILTNASIITILMLYVISSLLTQ